jgi:hypothetical protein
MYLVVSAGYWPGLTRKIRVIYTHNSSQDFGVLKY